MSNTSKFLMAAMLSSSLVLVGCGGSSSSGGGQPNTDNPDGNDGGGETVQYQGVEGPLDAVQQPLSEQVFASLGEGATGTPLEAPVSCLEQIVVQDIVDILDAALGAVDPASAEDPQAAFEAAAANAQIAATELSVDLPNFFASLAGEGDCSSSEGSGGAGDGGNPLEGTPLQDLGAALAAAFENGGDPSDLDPTQLAALFADLSAAYNEGMASVPAEVSGAPVLGGALTTVGVALADLATVLDALASQDGATTSTSVATTLNHLLDNVLINIVPVAFIEAESGQDGVFSDQITAGVDTLTEQLDAGLAQLLLPLFDGFATLQDAIAEAMAGGDSGSDPGAGASPFDALLAALEDAAAGMGDGGETGPTGTPLDILLAPLVDAMSGGEGSTCPLADSPLSDSCTLVDSLTSALALDPNADPLTVLEGLVTTLFGDLIP